MPEMGSNQRNRTRNKARGSLMERAALKVGRQAQRQARRQSGSSPRREAKAVARRAAGMRVGEQRRKMIHFARKTARQNPNTQVGKTAAGITKDLRRTRGTMRGAY